MWRSLASTRPTHWTRVNLCCSPTLPSPRTRASSRVRQFIHNPQSVPSVLQHASAVCSALFWRPLLHPVNHFSRGIDIFLHRCLLLPLVTISALESKQMAAKKVAAVIGYGDCRRRMTLPTDNYSPTHSNVTTHRSRHRPQLCGALGEQGLRRRAGEPHRVEARDGHRADS